MKILKPTNRGWKLSGLILVVSASLSACSDSDTDKNEVEAELIVLQEGQSPSDVIGGGNPPEEQQPDEDIVITDNPEISGQPLFNNPENSQQVLSGFEFCCGQYNTYAEHGFESVTGDFDKLDGGWWGADVAGVIGEFGGGNGDNAIGVAFGRWRKGCGIGGCGGFVPVGEGAAGNGDVRLNEVGGGF